MPNEDLNQEQLNWAVRYAMAMAEAEDLDMPHEGHRRIALDKAREMGDPFSAAGIVATGRKSQAASQAAWEDSPAGREFLRKRDGTALQLAIEAGQATMADLGPAEGGLPTAATHSVAALYSAMPAAYALLPERFDYAARLVDEGMLHAGRKMWEGEDARMTEREWTIESQAALKSAAAAIKRHRASGEELPTRLQVAEVDPERYHTLAWFYGPDMGDDDIFEGTTEWGMQGHSVTYAPGEEAAHQDYLRRKQTAEEATTLIEAAR